MNFYTMRRCENYKIRYIFIYFVEKKTQTVMRKIFLLLLSVVALSATAQKRVYLSSKATVGGDGSQSAPFNRVESALDYALAEDGQDTIFVEVSAGLYSIDQTINITKKGSAPIVVRGAEGCKPVISGAIKLSDWTLREDGLWQSKVSEVSRYGLKVEQLYINGKRAVRAKTPDNGWFYIKKTIETPHYTDGGQRAEFASQKIYTNPENLESMEGISTSDLVNVTAMFYHKWDNTRKYLDFAKPDSGIICISGLGMKPWNKLDSISRFTLENYRAALTMAGEWFMESDGTILYIPREGEKIGDVDAYVPLVDKLLTVKGDVDNPIEDITFENISFCHTAYRLPITGAEPEQAAASVGAAIEVRRARGINFLDCEIKHTGGYALWYRDLCYDSRLERSFIYDMGAGGVKVGEPYLREDILSEPVTSDIVVDNNIIQSAGHILPCGVGVAVLHAANNRVSHNDIGDLLYSGVSVGWVWGYVGGKAAIRVLDEQSGTIRGAKDIKNPALGNEIAYNHIHHIGWGELADMGAVYTLGESYGTRIHNNVIHDVYSYTYGGWGLYTDEGSTDITMENNLVYGCKSGGFHQHYGKDNIIRNNIFAFSHLQQLRYTLVEEHRSFTFKHNIVVVDHGKIIDGDWDKGILDMDENLYWDMRGADAVAFNDYTPQQWKRIKDANSLIADPSFVDPYGGDYTFSSKKSYKKIGFVPFDYSQAGVYGCETWRAKAVLSQERIDRFSEIVRDAEESYSKIYEK